MKKAKMMKLRLPITCGPSSLSVKVSQAQELTTRISLLLLEALTSPIIPKEDAACHWVS